jgi:hypothetical protein
MSKDNIIDLKEQTNNGLDVFQYYIGGLPPIAGNKTAKNFKSVFRNESTPSASIYFNSKSNTYCYKDHGGDGDHLDAFAFVQQMFTLSFPEAMAKISQDLCLNGYTVKPEIVFNTKFNEIEAKFWKDYGITPEVIKRYDVKSVKSFKTKGGYVVNSTKDNPIFAYQYSESFFRIYQPFSKDHKHTSIGAKPINDVFGLDKLPQNGEMVFIAAGQKDTLSLVSRGYNAICFYSETTHEPVSVIKDLKLRFKDVIVIYDYDLNEKQTGQKRSKKICETHGLKRIQLKEFAERGLGKDVSDYFKCFEDFETVLANTDLFYVGSFDELVSKAESFASDHFVDVDKMVDVSKENTTETAPTFLERANQFLFDVSKPIEKPVNIIDYNEETISSAQNLTVIIGQSKAGKTGLFAGLVSGTINSHCDTLGFNVQCNEAGKLVIHIDSEQSEYNHHRAVKGILSRAEVSTQPVWFKSYLFRQFAIKDRKAALTQIIEHWAKEFNGVHSIFIDGIADFSSTVNDETEANETVLFFEQLAIKFNCPVITVLHLNPGSIEKSRGHLGSQLERKCESMLSISKDNDSGVSTIEAKLLRNAGTIPNLQFQYDLDKGYHTSCGIQKRSTKEEKERNETAQMALDIFDNGKLKFSYGELVDEIKSLHHLQERTAKGKIALMRTFKFIENEGDTRSKLRLCNGAILVQNAP